MGGAISAVFRRVRQGLWRRNARLPTRLPIAQTMGMEKSIADLADITPDDCGSLTISSGASLPAASIGLLLPDTTPEDVNARETSRQAMLALAIRDQRAEIMQHLRALVLRRGQIVTLDEAARDWIPNHAAAWRARHESDLHNAGV